MTNVFISYSHVDSPVAEEVEQLLTELEIEYFRDVKDIDLGESITARVREGVDSCSVLLVVISPASLKSHWVPYEIGHASALRKKIVPFLTHPSIDVPHYIRDMNCATKLEQLRDYFGRGVPEAVKSPNPPRREVEQPEQESGSGLTKAEDDVLRVLANATNKLTHHEIENESGLAPMKVDFCLRSLKEKSFVHDWPGGWKIEHEGVRVVLNHLDDSAVPRLTADLTNAEVMVLRVLANAANKLTHYEIVNKSGLASTKVEFCLQSLKEKSFVHDWPGGWKIEHEGMGYLLSKSLDTS